MLISCSRCGRIHERGACPVGRPSKKRDTQERSFRSSRWWTQASIETRKRDRFLCAACEHRDPPRYVTERLSVHHIVPLAEDYSLRLDPANLITLCPVCHELAEAGAISRADLHRWAVEAMERDARHP